MPNLKELWKQRGAELGFLYFKLPVYNFINNKTEAEAFAKEIRDKTGLRAKVKWDRPMEGNLIEAKRNFLNRLLLYQHDDGFILNRQSQLMSTLPPFWISRWDMAQSVIRYTSLGQRLLNSTGMKSERVVQQELEALTPLARKY